MSNQWIELVRAWRQATCATIGTPSAPEIVNSVLHRELLKEEWEEADAELAGHDVPCLAKEICDVIFVCLGIALDAGIELDPCFREVCRSNMSKVGAPKNASGKTTKGPNYSPADMVACIERQKVPTRFDLTGDWDMSRVYCVEGDS